MKTNFNFKKITTTSILVSLLFLNSGGATFAQATRSATLRLSVKETALRTRASNEISRRVTALTALITRITALKHLSATDKTNYTNQIQAQIDSLNTLKTKIDADTDPTTLKTDVASIVTSYRIFLLFIPKIHLLAAADTMTEVANTLTDLATRLGTLIQTAKNNGDDVATLEAKLTDLNSKIADAKTQYGKVESLLTPLTPEGYPGNKPTLLSAREALKLGTQDLKAARADVVAIRDGLKKLTKNQTATQSGTPTP